MLPSPELRRRNIDRLPHIFSRKQMANWACDTIASNMYVDRPSRALAFYCAHSTMDTRCTAAHSTMDTALHCAQLKENPRWKKWLSFVNFCELCRSRARQWGQWVAIQYNRWRLCCREHHGMFPVSWGLKWYFGKNISPYDFVSGLIDLPSI